MTEQTFPPKAAPSVTLEDLRAAIKGETFTVLPDGRTTVCQITLDNDFTVLGISACVSAENYNKEEGERLSRKNATATALGFLAFRLADKLMKEKA